MTQSFTSPTGSPPKKKQYPKDKDNSLHEDDDDWGNKFNEFDSDAPTHAEGIDRTQNK